MPRFFLNLHGSEILTDPEGRHYDNIEQALQAARQGAGELIAEQISRGELVDLAQRLELIDEREVVVATLQFRDLFVLPPV